MSRPRRGLGLPARVEATVRRFSLFGPGASVLCAVSGGADSLVLCEALRVLASRWALRLVVAHVDHGLRAGSAADVERVAAYAASRGLPFVSRRVVVSPVGSVEAAAREARLGALADLAHELGVDTVALGHTASDRAETLLLFLARGASRRGLGSPEPRRHALGVTFVRPLCEIGRAEVRAYARREALPFADDPMNEDLTLTRNLLRREVVPRLDALYPGVEVRLGALAQQLAEEEDFLDAEVKRRLGLLEAGGAGASRVLAAAVTELPPVLRPRALGLCLALARGHCGGLTRAHLTLVEGLLRPGSRRVALPGASVRREGEWLCFEGVGPTQPGVAGVEAFKPLRVSGAGVFEPRPGIKLEANLLQGREAPRGLVSRQEAVFDGAVLEAPLWLRPPRPGDRIRLSGVGRQKLSDTFIDAKVPRPARAGWPVLVAGDELLWVPGLRRSPLHAPLGTGPLLHLVVHGLPSELPYGNHRGPRGVGSARDRKGQL